MLSDDPPHSVSLYSSTAANDAGGGTAITYSPDPVQSAVPCLINTASAKTVEMYAQQQIEVSLTIGIKSSTLDGTPQRGWKAVADDTGESLLIVGIRSGRVSPMGGVPALTYLDCQQIL